MDQISKDILINWCEFIMSLEIPKLRGYEDLMSDIELYKTVRDRFYTCKYKHHEKVWDFIHKCMDSIKVMMMLELRAQL